MQVVGAPAAATSAGAVPVGTWDTPTERIFERRKSPQVAWPPPATAEPALRKSTVLGIALGTFACGVLAATAVDRLRPHARFDVVQTAPAATPTPTSAPSTKEQVAAKPVAPTTAQPTTAPAPLAAAGPIVQQLAPPPPEPLPALAAPAADTAPVATARPAPAKATRVRPPAPPATKLRAAAVEPPPLTSLGVAFPAPAPTAPAKAKASSVTPPTPGKWVDPFAD
jgi:hypothetical protein